MSMTIVLLIVLAGLGLLYFASEETPSAPSSFGLGIRRDTFITPP